MRLFEFAALCGVSCCVRSVFGLTLFSSLYVSEFLIAACGVSPLRGRPALSKAKGLDPNAFSFWCGFGGAVRSLAALFCFSFYCYCDRNLLRFAVLSLKLICRYYRFRRFRLPALIRQPQLHYSARSAAEYPAPRKQIVLRFIPVYPPPVQRQRRFTGCHKALRSPSAAQKIKPPDTLR